MVQPLIVLTTVGNAEQGRRVARELVESRLAACVNCIPGLTSVYRWNGRVEEDAEVLLLAKTTAARVDALKAHLLRIHPYEVPEFLVLAVSGAGEAFQNWLGESTGLAREGE